MTETYDFGEGAKRIQKYYAPEISRIGAKTADILDYVFQGIYHVETSSLKKATWDAAYYAMIRIAYRHWSTYDTDTLTRLVVIAHEMCVRVEINPCNPTHLELLFHERQRNGDISERHATIESAIEKCRKWLGVDIGAESAPPYADEDCIGKPSKREYEPIQADNDDEWIDF